MGSFNDNGSVNKTLYSGWNHAIFFYFKLSTISNNRSAQWTIYVGEISD